jgi:hypothetical protein
LNVLNSQCVISTHALVKASSKVSRGLLPILHPQDHTNLTSQNFFNPTGIRRIDALNFVANSDVKSKNHFDVERAVSASFSILLTSLISGLFVNCIFLSIK